MTKIVSYVKVSTGGYNVLVRGEHFGWARMQDTAEELGRVALIGAF